MKRRSSAFTLIELLVVIAIIAILAAILFPVFAQAKKAAKGAASLSNVKETSLGVIMYTGDSDDEYPPAAVWNMKGAPYTWGGVPIETWSYIDGPYVKNSQIYMDPLIGDENGFPGGNPPLEAYELFNPQYGYNWTLLNGGANNLVNIPTPWSGGTSPGTEPTTFVSRPADMVMLASLVDAKDPGFSGWWSCCGVFTGSIVEGPYCNSSTTNCSNLSSPNSWGIGSWWGGVTYSGPTQTAENAGTHGVAWRASPFNTDVAFCDGHVKSMAPGALAVGTNWNPNIKQEDVKLMPGGKDVYRWWQF